MNRSHLSLAVCLLALSLTAAAQSRESSKPGLNKPIANATPAKDPEAERLARERRAHALSLLVSLGTDAGSFKDVALRARTQARIADALWQSDSDRARILFRKAWDAAEVADAEGQQRMQEDAREQQAKSGGGGYAIASAPEIRKEVLRLAVKHDTALGEEFLAKLNEQKAEETQSKRKRIGPDDRDYAVTQRLEMAREMLAAGDEEKALQFAAPVLGTISSSTIDFLSSLRERDAVAADQRYAAMLSIAVASPQTDPNIASLLSSYIFTPHLYVTFIGSGGAAMSNMGGGGPADVAPALRDAFFRAAGEILMRPIPPDDQNQASAVINKYYVIKRLTPLFEQFGPAELAAGLRTQLEALSSMVSESQRQSQDEPVREGIQAQEVKQSFEQSQLEKIDRARTSDERDSLYLQLATYSANAGNLMARDYVSKIEEMELRNSARAYVDASLAVRTIEKKDAETALALARTGDLSHLQRVWTMSRAATLLSRSDHERALRILEDAATEARRIGASDADRPRALLAIANALLPIDRGRGWDAVDDAVRSANSAPDFTGEDGQLTFRIITRNSRSINQHSTPDFDLAGIFHNLALENYERAVELAQVFQHDAPRSHAVIAIALAVLDEKKK